MNRETFERAFRENKLHRVRNYKRFTPEQALESKRTSKRAYETRRLNARRLVRLRALAYRIAFFRDCGLL